MNIADIPSAAVETLKTGLDRYPAGVGGERLRRKGIDLTRLKARGALAEARLGLEDIDVFLTSQGDALDALFKRLRVMLFDDETPVGSAGLLRDESGKFDLEHVTLGGAEKIVEGLREIEGLPESPDSEVRLLQIPRIYFSSLVLIRNGISGPFLILAPPYPEGVAARTPVAVRGFIARLLEEQRSVFPPA